MSCFFHRWGRPGAPQLHVLGIETRIFHCTFETFEGIQKKICLAPDIVGIYSMVTLSPEYLQDRRNGKNLPALLSAGGRRAFNLRWEERDIRCKVSVARSTLVPFLQGFLEFENHPPASNFRLKTTRGFL